MFVTWRVAPASRIPATQPPVPFLEPGATRHTANILRRAPTQRKVMKSYELFITFHNSCDAVCLLQTHGQAILRSVARPLNAPSDCGRDGNNGVRHGERRGFCCGQSTTANRRCRVNQTCWLTQNLHGKKLSERKPTPQQNPKTQRRTLPVRRSRQVA